MKHVSALIQCSPSHLNEVEELRLRVPMQVRVPAPSLVPRPVFEEQRRRACMVPTD